MNDNYFDVPILVTGATGYIGSRILRRFIMEGRETHIIVRASSDISLTEDLVDNVISHTHDGTTDGMISILKEARPGIVIHMASLFLSQHQSGQVMDLLDSNIAFGTQLLEAVSLTGPVAFINTGTFWQHYENHDYSPVNLYAATKQAFETILQYYTETVPLKAVTLKFSDTYGPDDPRPKIMNLLIDLLRSGGQLDMSPGEQTLDILHIDDIVGAYMHTIGQLNGIQEGLVQNYALLSGESVKLRDLVNLIEMAAGKSLDINWGGRPYREREPMKPWDTGNPLPGWKPTITLKEGIKGILAKELCRE